MIIAIINLEAEEEAFRRMLADRDELFMSAPTLLETMIVARGRFADDGGERARAVIDRADILTLSFDKTQADLAIDAYRRYGRGSGSPARLNFGDCFSYALARALDAPLLYKGEDFIHTDVDRAVAA